MKKENIKENLNEKEEDVITTEVVPSTEPEKKEGFFKRIWNKSKDFVVDHKKEIVLVGGGLLAGVLADEAISRVMDTDDYDYDAEYIEYNEPEALPAPDEETSEQAVEATEEA